MRLSKSAKKLIVDQIMNDVPQINYWKQAQEAITKHYVSKMPDEVKVLYNDPKLEVYLDSAYIIVEWYARHNGYRDASMHMKGVKVRTGDRAELNVLIRPLRDLNEKQSKDRDKLHDQLTASIFHAARVKLFSNVILNLKNTYRRYLKKIRYLPAVTNLKDTLKDAGWVDAK